MGDIINAGNTKTIQVRGMIVDVRNGEATKMRQHTITVRMTKQTVGETISFEDPLRGIIIAVPAEPIIAYYKEEEAHGV